MFKKTIIILSMFAFTPCVFADLPITIENLLSDKGTTRLGMSMTYINSENISSTFFGETISNTDVLATSISVKYGISSLNEIYVRATYLLSENRIFDEDEKSSTHIQNYISDSWIGIGHKFNNDSESPALFGFAEVQVSERQADKSYSNLNGVAVGMMTYQTFDPIVLSLSGNIQIYKKTRTKEFSYTKGNIISLTPSVSFAVNDKITITSGFNWSIREPNSYNGKAIGIKRTSTSLDLGVGFGLDNKDTLSLNVSPQVSGGDEVYISFNWLHRF